MITLTTPVQVATVLGSPNTVPYQKLDFTTASLDMTAKSISGSCLLISTSNPTSPPIPGSYTITTQGTPQAALTMPDLSFYTTVTLTGPQQTAVSGWIAGFQNNVEAGVVSIAMVAGTQSAGL
jgi:hypothetical protein